MKVFKFGGASVKDTAGVRNVATVLSRFMQDDLLVVVSAMGKTTNALERVLWAWREGGEVQGQLDALRHAHLNVLRGVVAKPAAAEARLTEQFEALQRHLRGGISDNPDHDYDQVVGYGELWSTLVVHAHLQEALGTTSWLDARKVVRTDACYRSARVDWDASAKLAEEQFGAAGERKRLNWPVVTQGFIGATEQGRTTTLGREGSDFSAAIFAFLLDAESVTIWKDVPGMFNADPNKFPDTRLLRQISYMEAIELSYFGASVIHPRTLQPLQQKHIPLYVRSFMDLDADGSTIGDSSESDSQIPSFIIKPGQLLISITPRDLSFMVEENLHHIFGLFARNGVRIELMQNSAVAFTVAVDDGPRSRALIVELSRDYSVRWNEGCELLTVRHYDEATLERLLNGREPLVEQRSRSTARFVLK